MLLTPHKDHIIKPDQPSTCQFQQSNLILFNHHSPGPTWKAEYPVQPGPEEYCSKNIKDSNQQIEIQSPSQFIQNAKLIDQSLNDVERFLQPKEIIQKQMKPTIRRKTTGKSTRKQFLEKMAPYLNLFDLDSTIKIKQKYLKIDDTLALGWNMFFLTQMLLILVYSPLSKSFHLFDLSNIFIVFNCIEICLKLMTEFPKQGTMIVDIRQICKNYCKTQIIFDTMIIIALLINNLETFINQFIIALVLFPKVNKQIILILLQNSISNQLIQYIYQKSQVYQKNGLSPNFTKLICLFVASILYGGKQWELQGVVCMGIILNYAPNYEEQIFTYCIIVISLISQIAYFFNSFHLLCSNDKQLYQLNAFFNKYKINIELKTLILNYLHDQQLIDQQIVSQIQHKQLLNELNRQKRKQLLRTYFSDYSDLLINRLVELSVEQQCSAGEIIFQKGDQDDDQALYLILEGNVEVSCFDKSIEIIPQMGSFGEVTFFTGFPRNITIQSHGPSTLLKIPRKLFFSLLTPKDKEYYCQQRDIISFNNIFPMMCPCCKEFSHEITDCPILTLKIDKTSIIEKVNQKFTQQRKYIFRRKRTRINGRIFKNDGNFLKQELQQLYWNQYQNDSFYQKKLFHDQQEIIEVDSQNEYLNNQEPSIGQYHKINSDAKSSGHYNSDQGKSEKSSIFVHQHQDMKYIEQQLRDLKDFERCCDFKIYLIHNNFDQIQKFLNK